METITANPDIFLPTSLTISDNVHTIDSTNIDLEKTIIPKYDLKAIWVHDKTFSNELNCAIKNQLNEKFKYAEIFTDISKFYAYLDRKHILPASTYIICGKQSEELCRLVKQKSQKFDVYELDITLKQSVRKSSNTWCTFSNEGDLFEKINEDLERNHAMSERKETTLDQTNDLYKKFFPPLGILDSLVQPKLFEYASNTSMNFVLSRLIDKIIVEMRYESEHLKEMWCFCRENYPRFMSNTDSYRKQINELAKSYDPDCSVWYYTEDKFLVRLVSGVFKQANVRDIYALRCYISDLHRRLKYLHEKRQSPSTRNQTTVYRGKKLPLIVLQQLNDLFRLKNVKVKLISINGFLSTTAKKKVAKFYADTCTPRDGYESVIFRMHIDETMDTIVPRAELTEDVTRFPDDKEILFSTGSIWKITSMRRKKSGLWIIVLKLCNDFDDHLKKLYDELPVDQSLINNHLFLLAKTLHKLGKFAEAGEFYDRLLDEVNLSKEFKGLIHFHLATLRGEQGQYRDAQKHYEQALELNATRISNDNEATASSQPIYATNAMPSRMMILNNKGSLYKKMGQHLTAHRSYEMALQEQGCTIHKAIVHNNLGNLEYNMGNISEAERNLQLAVNLAADTTWLHRFQKDLDTVRRERQTT